jgi:hypothetical protein
MNLVSVLQSKKKLVDVTGIEPVTPCLQRLDARRINNLHGVRWNATGGYKCFAYEGLSCEVNTP